jgi:hypothetical protein
VHTGQQRAFSHFLVLCADISMSITKLNTLKSYRNALKSEVTLLLQPEREHALMSPLRRLGKSLNEIRQEVKEVESLRLKKWSEERKTRLQEEKAAAVAAGETQSGVSTSLPTPTQRKTNRNDNPPVKVAENSSPPKQFLILP